MACLTKHQLDYIACETAKHLGCPDEEDITLSEERKLKFKDRFAGDGDGMGYVILRKNKSFAEQLTKENTIYEIRYDFTLTADFTMPANCVLKFNGGSVNGGHILIGQNTKVDAGVVQIFGNELTPAGTWSIDTAYPEWFGAKSDGVTDDTRAIQSAVDISATVLLIHSSYLTTSEIVLKKGSTLQGVGKPTISCVFDPVPSTKYTLSRAIFARDVDNISVNNIKVVSNSCGILFVGCKNISISEVEISTIRFGITLSATLNNVCENFIIKNCIINNPGVFNKTHEADMNPDGIHLLNGCRNGIISNIIGHTGDDFLAFNAVEGISGEGTYAADLHWLQNITVENVITEYNGYNSIHAVRFYGLDIVDGGVTYKCHIDNITFKNCVFSSYMDNVFATNMADGSINFGNERLHLESVLFENCAFKVTDGAFLGHFLIRNVVSESSIILKNCSFCFDCVLGGSYASSVIQPSDAVLNRLHLIDCVISVGDNASLYPAPGHDAAQILLLYINQVASTINDLRFINIDSNLSDMVGTTALMRFNVNPDKPKPVNNDNVFGRILIDNIVVKHLNNLLYLGANASCDYLTVRNMNFGTGYVGNIRIAAKNILAEDIIIDSDTRIAQIVNGTENICFYRINKTVLGASPFLLVGSFNTTVVFDSDYSTVTAFDFNTGESEDQAPYTRIRNGCRIGVLNYVPGVAKPGDEYVITENDAVVVKKYSGGAWVTIQ